MEKGPLLYEGKAKRMYVAPGTNRLIVDYKDDATAFDGQKKEVLVGKGRLNNAIASVFFEHLSAHGVESHFIRKLSERESLVKRLEIIPVEIIVRNIIAGSFAKRFGLKEGDRLSRPILEFCLKDDALHDPIINHYYIYAFNLASSAEMKIIEETALQINTILQPFLAEKGIVLVDFKLEFGRYNGRVLLGDEISPDTCRFWDAVTAEKMDKDRFRRDLGNVTAAYEEVLRRIQGGI